MLRRTEHEAVPSVAAGRRCPVGLRVGGGTCTLATRLVLGPDRCEPPAGRAPDLSRRCRARRRGPVSGQESARWEVAGEAGVVAVRAVAAGGAGAEHGFAAFRAAHEAGELVVGAGRGAVGMGFAAGVEQGLGLGPGVGGDDRFVGVGDGVVAEGQLAQLDTVVSRSQSDRRWRRWAAMNACILVSSPGVGGKSDRTRPVPASR